MTNVTAVTFARHGLGVDFAIEVRASPGGRYDELHEVGKVDRAGRGAFCLRAGRSGAGLIQSPVALLGEAPHRHTGAEDRVPRSAGSSSWSGERYAVLGCLAPACSRCWLGSSQDLGGYPFRGAPRADWVDHAKP